MPNILSRLSANIAIRYQQRNFPSMLKKEDKTQLNHYESFSYKSETFQAHLQAVDEVFFFSAALQG
jgi:exonuclease I